MPPKKGTKHDQKSATAANHDLESAEQDPLQAVILADSFNRRFDVLCVDKPRVSFSSLKMASNTESVASACYPCLACLCLLGHWKA